MRTTTSALYQATWSATGVADGSHTLEARATDSTSNQTTALIGVTVSNSTTCVKNPAGKCK